MAPFNNRPLLALRNVEFLPLQSSAPAPPAYPPKTTQKSDRSRMGRNVSQRQVADRQGFEPWRRFPAYTLSRRAPSTTRPPVRGAVCSASCARFARGWLRYFASRCGQCVCAGRCAGPVAGICRQNLNTKRGRRVLRSGIPGKARRAAAQGSSSVRGPLSGLGG